VFPIFPLLCATYKEWNCNLLVYRITLPNTSHRFHPLTLHTLALQLSHTFPHCRYKGEQTEHLAGGEEITEATYPVRSDPNPEAVVVAIIGKVCDGLMWYRQAGAPAEFFNPCANCVIIRPKLWILIGREVDFPCFSGTSTNDGHHLPAHSARLSFAFHITAVRYRATEGAGGVAAFGEGRRVEAQAFFR